jgi:[ribosomal protein S18]-alanine N-acetyltransferase
LKKNTERIRIDIGIGMKPELTGKGAGSFFFKTILSSIRADISIEPQRLTVATFNERAIHLYKKFGFVQTVQFPLDTGEFTGMVRRT